MEFKDKDVEFKHLIDTIHTYLPQAKCDDVTKAYNLAEEAHKDQRRVSGEPYILHPLAVAQILADMKIDTTTITASLLHDVVEDTSYTLEDIKKMFGKEVAFLVDGVTKLSRLNYRTKEDQQLNSMRKMFLAMAKDVRVVVIKLADRLHNMRTLRYMRSDKQKRIAQETLEIFAPLAHRLGIFNIKWELEDLSFRYLEPDKYYDLVDQMKQKRHVREEIVNEAIDVLKKALDEAHIHCEINGRPKHFYSIYKKMKKDNRDLSQVYDLFAIRVIVDDVKDCYGVLGIVHSLWKPLPYRFKDYIAMPKPNNYQSLHTTVIGTRGQPVEIQIRTWEMHRIAEYGVAAHWRYKEGNQTANKDAFDEKMGWLRNLLEWQDTSNPKEFVNALKLDAFSDEVFVFSPRGDVIDLPQGSIPIDFAYRIHTDVGHRCVGAKINGKIVPLDYKLKNGDIVEIITSKVGKPSLDWLNIVGSSESRSKIRSWFKKENREENIAKGLDALERECKRLGHDWKALNVGDGRVVFGGGLLDKFGWSEGQKVTLSDKYEGEHYSFEYAGKDCAWGSKSDMNIYMSIDDFNELFDNDAAYFNGYVSDEKLDLDARYFAGDTTPDDMRAVGDQFIGMMSKMIGMMVGLAVFIFLLFMYLLTKAVIDHSARSISYMKVFGYRDSEISHLYIRSITLCVAASLVLSLPVIIGSLTAIFRSMLLAYNGNIEIYAPARSMVACVGIGFATYLVVALLHMRSIKRVGLAEALKVQE